MRTHVVQKGDTLWKIAKQYGISFDELKRLNGHLANPDYVVPGMEIILPDAVSNNSAGNTGNRAPIRTTSYKEKLTEPIAPIVEQTQPTREVAPSKEQLTRPMPELPPQPAAEVKPSKEKLTQPLPEYVMPTPPPQPAPMPQIQPEIMPEFHFAPQFTFTPPQPMPPSEKIIMTQPMPQPQPQPVPMPIPQPIMIEIPKPEVRIEEKEVVKTEYVPVPQPYYVYVPYCPCPEPMPMKKPCKCKKHHHVKPCGCGGGMQQPMPMQMPIQHMDAPCGCNDSAPYNHMMMPYDYNFMQPDYMEPNYEMAPMMDMDDHGKDSILPDWLVDSTNATSVMGSYEQAKSHMSDDVLGDKGVKGDDFYHHMKKDDDYSPTLYDHVQYDMNYPQYQFMPQHVMPEQYNMQPYMPEHYNMPYQAMPEQYNMQDYYMQQSMPYHMMPQQHMMPQHMNYPSQPYYPTCNCNQQSPDFRPWNY
ncbi:Spore coat assembly protein SafA OS=Ureibacillus acetophenoni OX=614649 GN=SAMN05877842_102332 PE=4 SV=1 [Ureibacillus acetophenoni]